jgi:Ca-activated chloride channel family protein
VALALGLVTSDGSAAGKVLIVQPRPLATVLGTSSIELRVLEDDAPVVKVEIYVDGRLLTVLSEPPWTANWEAGDGTKNRHLEAIAHFRDASHARAVVQTSPLRINQYEEVALVNLYPVVVDRSGAYVNDLTQSEFSVFENGRSQTIRRFTSQRQPLRIALLIDTSSSMSRGRGERLRAAQEGALELLELLEPGDEGLVASFDDEVRLLQGLTSELDLLRAAVRRAAARGGTALYDAIWRTAEQLRGFEGRRVIVLLSDGRDEAYDGLGPGSLHTLREAMEQAQRSDVMVFSIGLGSHLDEECAYSPTPLTPQVEACPEGTLAEILRRLADETGGQWLLSPGSGRLRKAFRDVATTLRSQYSLAYASDDLARDGKFREVRITVPGKDLRVICRRGYFASRER